MAEDNYWTRTDDMIRENGGKNPGCPSCGDEMYAMDDHGRFACGCGYQNEAAMTQERLSRSLFPRAWAAIDRMRNRSKSVDDKTNP